MFGSYTGKMVKSECVAELSNASADAARLWLGKRMDEALGETEETGRFWLLCRRCGQAQVKGGMGGELRRREVAGEIGDWLLP